VNDKYVPHRQEGESEQGGTLMKRLVRFLVCFVGVAVWTLFVLGQSADALDKGLQKIIDSQKQVDLQDIANKAKQGIWKVEIKKPKKWTPVQVQPLGQINGLKQKPQQLFQKNQQQLKDKINMFNQNQQQLRDKINMFNQNQLINKYKFPKIGGY
jgi:hypothetical protein